MSYLFRRLLHSLLLLFLISVLSFVFLQAAPGDFFDDMLSNPRIARGTVLQLKAAYGLGRPLPVRYADWFASVLRGELGFSFAYNMPVGALVRPRAWNTLVLTLTAAAISWAAALAIGTGAACARRKWIPQMLHWCLSILMSVPELLLSLALLMLMVRMHVFPGEGMQISTAQIIPPVIALALSGIPLLIRHTYSTVQEILGSPGIQAARAHGISGRQLVFEYALPMAANPLISLLGLSIGGLLSSSLVVEIVMGWPGLGPLFLDAIFSRDIYVVIAVTMLSALFLIGGNLLADLLLYAADPRMRHSE